MEDLINTKRFKPGGILKISLQLNIIVKLNKHWKRWNKFNLYGLKNGNLKLFLKMFYKNQLYMYDFLLKLNIWKKKCMLIHIHVTPCTTEIKKKGLNVHFKTSIVIGRYVAHQYISHITETKRLSGTSKVSWSIFPYTSILY